MNDEPRASRTEDKLSPEFKALWLDALRSGRYHQTQRRLRTKANDEGGFCCLGVALDLKDPGKWALASPRSVNYHWGNCSTAGLGEPLKKALGLSYRVLERLVNMNDEEDASFAQIADYIEKNL